MDVYDECNAAFSLSSNERDIDDDAIGTSGGRPRGRPPRRSDRLRRSNRCCHRCRKFGGCHRTPRAGRREYHSDVIADCSSSSSRSPSDSERRRFAGEEVRRSETDCDEDDCEERDDGPNAGVPFVVGSRFTWTSERATGTICDSDVVGSEVPPAMDPEGDPRGGRETKRAEEAPRSRRHCDAARRRQDDRVEWSPGMLVRMAIINVGYSVGDNLYRSNDRMWMAGTLLVLILANEFFSACLRYFVRTSKLSEVGRYVAWRIETMIVLVRLFSVTALIWAINEVVKYVFAGTDGATTSSIVIVIVVLAVVSDVIERVGAGRG